MALNEQGYALLATCGLISSYLIYSHVSRKRSGCGLRPPPGPEGKPIIRNILDLPFDRQWETAKEWSKKYGDLIYLNAVGQDLIYINSFDIATELLEKRSSLYSDRVQSTMLELMGLGNIFALMHYGDDWRLCRRLFHQEFNVNNAKKYKDTQTKYAHTTLGLLRDYPSSFEQHFKYFSSGIILEPVYGFKIKPTDDPYVRIVQDGLQAAQGLVPGAFLVDAIPILRYIPEWFPGAGFQKKARVWGKAMVDSYKIPFDAISEEFSKGTAQPSFATSWLSKIASSYGQEEGERIKNAAQSTAGTAFLAGYETTSATLLNFALNMVLHPEVQRKGHEELDRVIGRDRLPELEDRKSLPYVDAIHKEVLRWFPAIPLGVPHGVIGDDEYNGMHIPKGTALFANCWAMGRNEKDYGPDCELFRPERFLEADRRDPQSFVFGFGRRICPGRFLANNSLFILISCILQMFEICPEVDENGHEKPINPHWGSGISVHLEPFPATFKVRYDGAEKLVA